MANEFNISDQPGGGGGATTFLALTDTPASYAGQSGHPLRVKNLVDGVEFAILTTIDRFTANEAVFDGPDAASGTSRNGHSLIAFDDTVNEEIIFEGIIDHWYNPNESLQVVIQWAAASAIIGAVKWNVFIENLADGGQDLDVDGFGAGITGTQTTDGTSGVLSYASLSMSNVAADGIVGGNAYRMKVVRDAVSGGDTLIGDAQLLSVNLRMA